MIPSDKMKAVEEALMQSNAVSFRKLEITPSLLFSIMDLVQKSASTKAIRSISFSYNPLIGNEGAITIINNLPKSIREIGLVGCGIGDKGGMAILDILNEFHHLSMLCIEQNNFSKSIKSKFQNFRLDNPHILVVL